jgi:exosome complex RNA-binding protein Rrp4
VSASEAGGTLGVMADDPLREQLLRPPAEAWRPEPGDVVIGEVVEVSERRGFAERPYPVGAGL